MDVVRRGAVHGTCRAILILMLVGSVRSSGAEPLKQPAAASEPVKGLAVTWTSNATTWPIGTAMTFEATLTNTGRTPFLVDLFGDLHELYEGKHPGSYVSSCWALAWEPSALPRGPVRGRYTLDRSQFRLLKPGESHTTPLSFRLSGIPPATYRLRLAYVPRAATSAFSFPNHWQTQQHLIDPMWIGMVLSNPLTIEVVEDPQQEVPVVFQLTSAAFKNGEAIPAIHTCDGDNVSLPLTWTDPPDGTKSLALIADDPDAPRGRWVHWVVYGIPPSVRAFRDAAPAKADWPDGTRQGRTDFGRPGYGGPCPPSGTHRYVFTLYALDTALSLPSGTTAEQLEQAMAGHILAQARLLGTYRRAGR